MLTRRKLLKSTAAIGLTAAASGLAAPAIAKGARIRVGYVTPQSGPLAAFAEADQYILGGFADTDAGKNFEVIVKDSQSNPNRAAEVAQELIIDEEIDLMLVASTPETTNPVTTTCENEEIPCISTVAPWQPWFIGQQGNPGDPGSWQPFNYAYHFFWGLEDVIAVFTNMWGQLDSNKSVGALFPNDGDGNAWGDPNVGFPPVLAEQGYGLTDTGRYQNLTDDFTAQINAFKQANVEIVTGGRDSAGFHDFLDPGKAAGLHPKGGIDRQGDPVPAGGRGFGPHRPQPQFRSLVVAHPSLHVFPQRNFSRRPGRRVHSSHRASVDTADRLRTRAV